jgi:NifB/MoaA-like Fe-S oxidoreductase
MLRKFTDEFISAADRAEQSGQKKIIDIATGEAAAETIERLVDYAKKKKPNLKCVVHAVKNEFFGGNVSVSGLVTATDIIKQLKGKMQEGSRLLIPRDMLRREGDMFLDSITLDELGKNLNIVIEPICDGEELAWALTDEE